MKPASFSQVFRVLSVLAVAWTESAAQETVYVDQAATGANDGSSWPHSYADLQSALDHAALSNGQVKEIRVAQGTYRPFPMAEPFKLVDGVPLLGGYAGSTSRTPDARDYQRYTTVLSADVKGDDGPDFDNRRDNREAVLRGYEIGARTLVEGFTFTGVVLRGGMSGALFLVDSSPVIKDCVFFQNGTDPRYVSVTADAQTNCSCRNAAGASIFGKSSPRFEGCRFEDNFGAVAVCSGSAFFENCAFYGNKAWCGAALVVGRAEIDLRSCRFSGNTAMDNYGGAIATDYYPSEITIRDCTFDHNSAPLAGGAIHAIFARSLTIVNSRFWWNTCHEWGGGAVASLALEGLQISHSEFDNNNAVIGGAVLVSTSDGAGSQTARIETCEFSSNEAARHGGAIYANDYSPEGNDRGLEVRACTFWANRASQGGGISIERGSQPSRIVGSSFRENRAGLGGGMSMASGSVIASAFRQNTATLGGGISALYDQGSVHIANSLLIENEAEAFGGGVAGGSGNLQIMRCTIAQNVARAGGAGVFAGYDVGLDGSIIWNNTLVLDENIFRDQLAQLDVLGFATVQWNAIENWTGVPGGLGNHGNDPMFAMPYDPDDYGSLLPDFRLLPDSPAIDSGNPDYLGEPGETDLDGKPRVLCGRVDRGAYEYGVVGDVDCDRAVTLLDFREWADCATGPGEPIALGDCQALDFHTDGLIDLHDFAGFQRDLGE